MYTWHQGPNTNKSSIFLDYNMDYLALRAAAPKYLALITAMPVHHIRIEGSLSNKVGREGPRDKTCMVVIEAHGVINLVLSKKLLKLRAVMPNS
jgi:hypothetical protein